MNLPLLPEEIVNAFTPGNQTGPDAATLSDGTYVLVWQSAGQDGSGNGIVAQRFTAKGERIGTEFVVNATRLGEQTSPKVAATADGGYVVAWTGLDSSGTGIMAQRFDASGAPQGAEFLVNAEQELSTQNDADAIGLPGGGFVVSWFANYDATESGFVRNTVAQVFDGTGTPVGGEFTVNTTGATSSSFEDEVALAAIQPAAGPGLPGGGFVAVFTASDGSSDGNFAQRYDQAGTALGSEFQINTTTTAGAQNQPAVVGLAGGRFAVVWTDQGGSDGSSYGVIARVYEGDGTAVTGEIPVNQFTNSVQYQPAIAATTDGGFAVTWSSYNQDSSFNYAVVSRTFDADGAPTADETVVNSETAGNQDLSAVTHLANGNFVVAWTSDTNGDAGDGSGHAIAQRLMGDAANFTAPSASPEVEAVSTQRTISENLLNAAPQRIDADAAAAVSDADSTDFDGGRLIVSILSQSVAEDGFPVQDAVGQDQLGLDLSGDVGISGVDVSVGGTVIGAIASDGTGGSALIIDLNADADAAAVELLVENLTYGNLSDDPRPQTRIVIQLEDGDGATSTPVEVTIDVTADQDRDGFVRGETRVNTVTANNQDESAIAGLAGGGYVSVWTSRFEDGSNDGVFAQRYDATGTPVGAAFQVNTTTANDQFDASVAGLNDGGWVIVWDDDTTTGIRLNRYDAAGVRTITELQVETETSGTQDQPKVAALSNGGYVVTWTAQNSGSAGDGSGDGVFLQVYNAAGNAVGVETRANEQTTGAQNTAQVAALDDGRFAVVWEQNDPATGDGSGAGIFARTFSATGVAEGGEFQVNSFTSSTQSTPVIATLANGDIVAAWRSEGQDTSSGGIYYQRFTDQGAAVGSEIRVNDTTSGNQTDPAIVALTTGGFAIGWVDTSTPSPGSGSDVFVQVFDADGTRIDSQTRINTEVSGEQNQLALAALPEGNYVVQWTSQNSGSAGDGSGNGVFQQIVGDAVELAVSAGPVTAGIDDTVTLTETAVEGGTPVVGQGAIAISDADSTDFEGGELRLSRVTTDPDIDDYNAPDDASQDSLAIATTGGVTVAGTTVSVGGTAVATITSDGQNGADLVLSLLAGADAASMESVVEAIHYQNPSDDPAGDRTYSIRLTDGDGGSSAPRVFTVSVTGVDEPGAPEKVGPETQVNSFTAGEQSGAEVAALTGGGWVTVWRSADQDGSGDGVYFQRYDSDGNRAGPETLANTTVAGGQTDPVVAELSNGGWVIVWEGNGPGDSNGVFAQRYNADGSPAGGETLVNPANGSTDIDPAVIAVPGGGYVVSWTANGSQDGSGAGVFFQRFDVDGAPLGGAVQANEEFSSTQDESDITVLNDGRIVVVYTSFASGTAGDGSSDGVFARVFNPNGTQSVAEFQVNTATNSSQLAPAVDATANGGFVVAFEDNSSRDGSSTAIVAQRYDQNVQPVGDEFVVNDTRNSSQTIADVIGLTDGRFVVTWSDPNSLDGSIWAVLAQVYSASGARLDGPIIVNTEGSSTQYEAHGAALPNGAFVVGYYSETSGSAGDGSGRGVFQQVFGDPADFPGLNTAPVIEGAPDEVTFAEADVNAGFQRIDADKTIAVGDLDSPNFDGGTLSVAVEPQLQVRNNLAQIADPDGVAQDRIGLLAGDVGNGDVQFSGTGVGSTVSVEGTVIGTIASDGTDGQPFTLAFNGDATVEAVEAVLGNIAYANISDAPAATRRLTIDLTDDDGHAAERQFVTVNVTAEAESALAASDDRRVNAHTENGQRFSQIVELAGGGAVVVWQSDNQDNRGTEGGNGIFAQVYNADGVPVGPEIRVNEAVSGSQQDPAVTASDDGGFVVVWEDISGRDGSSWGIFARAFEGSGAAKGGDVQVNTTFSSSQGNPSVTTLTDGDVLVLWQDDGGADGSSSGIFAQRLDGDGNIVLADGSTPAFAVPASAVGDYQLNGSTANGVGGANDIVLPDPTGLGAQAYMFDAQEGPSISGILTSGATYSIEMRFSVDALPSQTWVKLVDFKDLTSDVGLYLNNGRLNFWPFTGAQGPQVGTDEDVTLLLTRDGGTDLVTVYLDGLEVLSYTDTGGAAVLDGPDNIVHLLVDDNAASQASSGELDFVRVYDTALTEPEIRGLFPNYLYDEVQINDTTAGSQTQPDVATLVADTNLPNGGSVAVWTSADAGGTGIYARIFDTSGAAQGGDIAINTTTENTQNDASVTGLTGGGFVVVWTDSATDGSSLGVFAQILDNSGAAVGGEFRVNTNTSSNQWDADVAALADGGFVVGWQDDSGRDGSGTGVFGQRFDAGGTRIDGEFQINQEESSTQFEVGVSAFGTGFAAVWSAFTSAGSGDGSNYGITLRTFTDSALPETAPDLSDFARTVTLFADDVTAGAQILDDAVGFSDPDSTDFDGGSLRLYYTTPNTANDQLGIAATGPVTITNGDEVRVGGTQVGTIDAVEDGTNGAALTIALNPAADAAAVKTLIEHVAFASTDVAANVASTQRGIGIVVTDDTGAQTEPDSILVVINAGSASNSGLALTDWGLRENEQDQTVETVSEAALIAAPIVIDTNVDFDDLAGTTFDGGYLRLSEVFSGLTTKIMSVQDQGTGAGQIGFDGTTATYEGTAIGTIDGTNDGMDGSPFQINFNGAATAQAVEALAEALTFQLTSTFNTSNAGLDLVITNGASASTGTSRLILPIDRDAVIVLGATAPESQVNTFTPGNQDSPRVAALSDGTYVVTWTSAGQDNPGNASARGLFAQLHSSSGAAIGTEFQVNDISFGDQVQPRATGLPNGNFVILWTENAPARDGSGQSVHGQLFQNDGTAVGAAFQVNDEVSGNQQTSQVVALDNGRFMTIWVSQTSGTAGDGSSDGIFGRVFDATGTAEGGEFQINTTTANQQTRPRAETLANGDVMVVWEERGGADGSSTGVFAQRIDASGVLVDRDGGALAANASGEFQVNTVTDGAQQRPDIAALTGGGFVFVWQSQDGSGDGIYGRLYDVGGVPAGAEFRINELVGSNQVDPVVVGRANGGFTVAWRDDSGIDGSGSGIVARNFLASGAADGRSFVVNTEVSSNQDQPELAELLNGTLVAVWRSDTSGSAGDGSNHGVFQSLIDAPALAAGAMNPVLEGVDSAVTFEETAVNAGLQLLDQDGAVSLTDMDSADFDGGVLTVSRLVGTGDTFNAQLGQGSSALSEAIGIVTGGGVTVSGATVLVGSVAVGQIDASDDGTAGADFVVTFNANATPERVEAVIARLGYANTSGDPAAVQSLAINVTDGDGGSTGNAVVAIAVTPEVDRTALPAGGEAQVNTYVPGGQSDAASAAIYDGSGAQIGYVTVWTSADQDRTQDGGQGIFGQRYDLNGDPVGAEFLVATHTEFSQFDAAVTGLPTGGFVVGWSDNSHAHPAGLAGGETSDGVFAQVFDAAGDRVGGEFLVNEITSSNQDQLDLAARANGNILAVYRDQGGADTSGQGIFLREFDSSGTPLGASVQVNTETSSNQFDPKVVVLDGGNVVVSWTSLTSGTAGDGSGNGVFAQVFQPNGTPLGSEIGVNTTTTSGQYEANIAALSGGDFVVVWRDDGAQDGSGSAVFQQRFMADGTPVGGEVRVNGSTVNSQYDPHIVALDTGGWVVAWSDNNGLDGSGVGVFGQEYDASGTRVDGEFQINTEVSSTQHQPRLVALPNGGYVASWTSVTSGSAGDGDNNGVFQQVFGQSGSVAMSTAPSLVGLSGRSFDEAAVNAGGQLLAPSIGFGDTDSDDFSGGALTLAMVLNDTGQPQFAAPDDLSQDQFGIDMSGSVSVAGGSVSVGGTAIGTVQSGGTNGAPLVIAFNGNATPDRVEALIEALTYANTSDDPEPSRLVSLQVTDGDGGSVRETIDVTIAPETDGGVPVGGEVGTNSFLTGSQDDSHVAALTDGGYVIVWTSNNQDGAGDNANGVFAQRYDASGAPTGGEFQVNTTTVSNQQNAQVLGLATGGFVVAWEDFSGQTGDDPDEEIVFQVYDALGAKRGGEVAIDSPANVNPDAPALAGFADGSFVIVHDGRDPGSPFIDRVYVQRFDDQGGAIGAETVIATPASNDTRNADVAVQGDGRFVVVFTQQNVDNPGDNDLGVYLQRFDATAAPVGGPIQVNTLERFSQFEPRVAATEDGGYVVVYQSDIGDDYGFSTSRGVYAQRFDANGNTVGDEFLVNRVVDGTQSGPDVVATSGGGFAITYSDSNGTDGSSTGVYLQQYDALARRIDGPVQVNEETSSSQDQGAIAALPAGNFVVSFTSRNSDPAGDGSGDGVFHRIIGDPADFSVGGAPVLEGINRTVTYAENDLNGVPQLIDANGAAAVSDPDSADFDGGSILVSNTVASAPLIDQINPPDDLTQDQLGLRQTARIGINGSEVSVDGTPVATIVQNGQNGTPFELSLTASATPEIVELLVENLTYRNISDDPLPVRELRVQVTDGDGGASAPVLVTVNITASPDAAVAVGGEVQVNTTDTGNEDNPAVAQLPGTDGDFVVVFESFGTDGSREGIYAQRFDVNGNPVARDGTGLASGQTDEFQINVGSTVNDQFDPQIAAFSDGSWVVVWTDDSVDGNGQGVAARRFNADGTPNAEGVIQVNDLISSNQFAPAVAVLDNDEWVVTWESINSGGAGDGNANGILARQFTGGAPNAGQFVVNTTSAGTQREPDITRLNDGGYLITWEDTSGADGSGSGIFAQRYDATGATQGTEFQLNSTTAGSQRDPQVTVLENGNLVAVWEDNAADLNNTGVFAQIYDVTGNAVSQEFRVNDQRISTQNDPAIAALDTGGFVIAWVDHNGTDGNGQGVFAQQYDAGGNRLDGQFQVNTTFSGSQNQPDIAGLPGGGFVVTWNGSVLIQVYGNDLPSVSPVSAVGDEDTAIVLDAAVFDAGFVDPNGNTLQEIRIDTFPTNGTLTLSGVPITAGQIVSRADLLAGNLVYTGNQDYNSDDSGTDEFAWTGSDGLGFAPSSVLATITVNAVNDAPGLQTGPDTDLTEGQPLNRVLMLSDPDTDSRTFTVNYGDGSAPQVFTTSILTPTLTKTYAAEGTYTVSVGVDDNSGAANATETASFIVTVVNGAPAAVNDFVTVSEDGPGLSGDVTTNDSDPGGDPFTVTQVNGMAVNVGSQITLASGALLTVRANGTFDYDPNGQFEALADFQNDTDSFTYTIDDAEGGTDTATVTVTIDGQNDDPVANDDTVAADSETPATGNVLANDTDADTSNTLIVTALNGLTGNVGNEITLASGALLTLNADGTFDYDPNGAFAAGGTDSFGYAISDQRGGIDSAVVTINVTSDQQPPVAVSDAVTTDEASSTSGNVLTNDTDGNQDPLSVTRVNGVIADVGSQIALGSGALLTLNADGTFDYDPNGQFETLAAGESTLDSFAYTVEDGQGGSDEGSVEVTVNGLNDAPVAVNDTDTTDEDTPLAMGGDLLANDSDVDASDTLEISEIGGSSLALGQPTAGSAGGLFTINDDGSYAFDPNGDFEDLAQGGARNTSVQYRVSDGNGGTDTAFFTVTVNGVNDAPDAVDDQFDTGETGQLVDSVTANDTDPDAGDLPEVTLVNGNAVIGGQVTLASGALLVMNASGNFTYDPNGQFNTLQTGESDTDSFTYTVEDGQGVTDTADVTITINGNSSTPVATDDTATTDEDNAVSGNVVTNDTDADGDTISVVEVNGVAADVGTQIALTSGALLTLNSNGTFDYDPNGQFETLAAGDQDTDSFTYLADDGNNGQDLATVVVTIDGVNDAPVARNDTLTTNEDAPLADNLFANNGAGADADVDAGDVITVTSVAGQTGNVGNQITLASGALLTVQSDGAVAYDPNGQFEYLATGETASESFDYAIADGVGAPDSATATVIVTGVNDDPDAVNDAENVAVDAVLTGNVLTNDTDPDTTDSLGVAAVNGQVAAVGTQITLASGALLTVSADGTFAYDQNGVFSGLGSAETETETFDYTITDGNGGTDTASVTITIGGSNLVPTATADTATTDEDTPTAPIDVLDNDTDPNPGDVLVLTSADLVSSKGGTITRNADDTLTYDPNGQFETLSAGDTTTDTFGYTIADGNGGTATGSVTVTITGANDDPVAQDVTATAGEDGPAITITGVFSDIDANDTLSVSVDTTGTSGSVTDNGDGTFTYDPNGQFEALAVGDQATDTFGYTVSDGNGGIDTAIVTVTINGVNDAPVAVDDGATTDEDSATSGSVLVNDGDVDAGDTLSVAAVNGSAANLGTQIALASGALLTLNADGSYAYDPNGQFEALAAGDQATDTFGYTVSDGNGGIDTAIVTVTINGVNDAPVAVDDSGAGYTTNEDTAFTTDNVLDNDTDADGGTTLVITGIDTTGTLGTVFDNGDGTFTYDPDGQFEALDLGDEATDTFIYTVSDGEGGTDTATVTIAIDGVTDGGGVNLIEGTSAGDALVGTAGADRIIPNGGFDIVTGNAGADEFVLNGNLGNGTRDVVVIRDYEIGVDKIGLDPGDVIGEASFGGRLYLQLSGGEGDLVYLDNVGSLDDLDFC